MYLAYGLAIDPDRLGELETENVASAEGEGSAFLGLILTPLLLFLMLGGGSIVAVDAISGEKERGTLETLLTTAARRSEIVSAKQLAVVTVGVAVTLINLLNLFVYVVLGLIDLPEGFAVSLALASLLVLLALFLPLTVLVSSALLLLSGWSKSYKEYQLYFFPLLLAFVAPTLVAILPGMDLRSAIALVPIAGVGAAVREVMVGELDWPFLALAFLSTGVAAWGAARLTDVPCRPSGSLRPPSWTRTCSAGRRSSLVECSAGSESSGLSSWSRRSGSERRLRSRGRCCSTSWASSSSALC